ncbi:MAG: hypothetical protein GOVbin655_59 [Prokaryotic dsDNA virus sp.]|nr:MAG: hypothetical protein GOVbin655_59 [Prokaryotic dsDNA virus sp.]
MTVKFDRPYSVVKMLDVNDWCAFNDEFNVQYDELDGKKRIIITKKDMAGIPMAEEK